MSEQFQGAKMTRTQFSSKHDSARKRRWHRKSRAGCRNCRLRRVKCDETQPACQNCVRLLVICNYDSTSATQPTLLGEDVLDFSMSETNLANDAVVTVLNRMVDPQYPQTLDSRCFRTLDKWDVDRLTRWHTRTVFTLGTQGISLCYQRLVSKEALQYPYLLHAILAMTAMHDRYLQASDGRNTDSITKAQYYHHSCAAELFNKRLSVLSGRPVDRNAIWTTGSILSNMSAFIMKTDDPEESWPLSPSSDSTLNWLELCQGLHTLYTLALPLDRGNLFFELLGDPEHSVLINKWEQDDREGIDGIPFSLIALYELNPCSNARNNPYHAAVRSFLQIWEMERTPHTAFRFLSFISLLRPEMKSLLVQKDSRALLLLAYWYTKMFQVHWWLHKRAVLQCTAICIYLQRHHSSDALLMDMLQYPLSKLAGLKEGAQTML